MWALHAPCAASQMDAQPAVQPSIILRLIDGVVWTVILSRKIMHWVTDLATYPRNDVMKKDHKRPGFVPEAPTDNVFSPG